MRVVAVRAAALFELLRAAGGGLGVHALLVPVPAVVGEGEQRLLGGPGGDQFSGAPAGAVTMWFAIRSSSAAWAFCWAATSPEWIESTQ